MIETILESWFWSLEFENYLELRAWNLKNECSAVLVLNLEIERKAWTRYRYVAGLDEAGRGAWAGPVVAAAVVFEKGVAIPGIDDSKKLTPKRREELFGKIVQTALCWGVGVVDSVEIDRINILEATKRAMLMAVSRLFPRPELLLIDGQICLDTEIPQKPVINGDARSHTIAAASILAKVTRDRLMVALDKDFPQYGFASHKGYGTREHRAALARWGCVSIHRKSYRPVAINTPQTSRPCAVVRRWPKGAPGGC